MAIYSGVIQKRRTIRILSVGEDRFLLCPPGQITLSAELSDYTNLKNHVAEWTQLKGTPVVLATPDQPETTFPHSSTEDKKFRFTLDPGTNQEIYKEMNIYYTPTSLNLPTVVRGKRSTASMTTHNLQKVDSFLFPPPSGEVRSNISGSPASKFTFDVTDVIGLGGNLVKMEILTDAGYVHNPEDLYATYENDDIPYEIVLPTGVYVFRFYYELDSGTYSYDSALLVSNAQAVGGVTAIDDILDSHTIFSDFSYRRVSIAVFSTTDDYTVGRTAAFGELSSHSRYTPTSLDASINPNLIDNLQTALAWGMLQSLVRLDPSSIGNE